MRVYTRLPWWIAVVYFAVMGALILSAAILVAFVCLVIVIISVLYDAYQAIRR